jgi:HAE1 family hydrophobic/amphiphilic exporter-1
MKVARTALIALALILSSLPLYAQEEAAEAEDYKVPDAYVEQVKAGGAILELSLADAIRLSLTNNLEIEIENYNEELNKQRVFGTKGFYDPVFTATIGWNEARSPTTRLLEAGTIAVFERDGFLFNSAFAQSIPWGGNYQIAFNNSRNLTNDTSATINPAYNAGLRFTFNQPLLRGFKQTQTERQFKLFNLDTEISDRQFQQRVSEIVEQVENQYWELAYAIENYEARRRSLELAIVQYRNNRKRVEIGVMAPIEITSSRAEVATREQEMIASRVDIINAQNQFKRLVAPDPQASLWELSMIPTERPGIKDLTITLDEAISTALKRRPELDQINLELEKNQVDRKYYQRFGKPAIDFQAVLNPIGTSGDDIRGEESPFNGTITTAWSQMVGFDYINWQVGVNVEIPLRNRENESQLAQLAIADRQMMSRMKDTQQLVIVDVRTAYESITTRKEGLEAAQVARELSEEQLEGENKRFEAGLSTNFEVLRYQRDLADAQVRELRAIVDYQLALTSLRTAMFTIVDENDIVTARRPE